MAILAALTMLLGTAQAASAVSSVTVGESTRALNGTNVYRQTDFLVLYTPARGASTGTNQWGFEAEVIDGKVTKVADGIGNMAIPANGYVLSGHGTSRAWLKTHAAVGATVSFPTAETPTPAAGEVAVGSDSRALNGTDVYRTTDFLVRYTPARGASTGTNQWGFEAEVIDGKVTKAQDGVGNMAIPSNGYVLSGHGTSRAWLKTYALVGATVVLGTQDSEPEPDPTPTDPAATDLLPDLGNENLANFSIDTTSQPGKKLLRFDSTVANIGRGTFELHGSRPAGSTEDMSVEQLIAQSDGTTRMHDTTATMYWSGDGHSHWHVRDLQEYKVQAKGGGPDLRFGEKHGFCFADWGEYSNWPANGTNGSPSEPVYTNCGWEPNDTDQIMGLSVGYADTYAASIIDQYLDVTGLPDGEYRIRVEADKANWFLEANEDNNATHTDVMIEGNTVTVLRSVGGV